MNLVASVLATALLASAPSPKECPSDEEIAALKALADESRRKVEVAVRDNSLSDEELTALAAQYTGKTPEEERHASLVQEQQRCREASRKRAEKQLEDEKRRLEREKLETQAREDAEADARVVEMLGGKSNAEGIGLFFHRCRQDELRQSALAVVQEQKEASKIAGVVHVGILYEAQTAAHLHGKLVKLLDEELQRRKFKPKKKLRCEDFAEMVSCIGSRRPACSAHADDRALFRLANAAAESVVPGDQAWLLYADDYQ